MNTATARFSLPEGSEASAPPERRGLPRDGVRLLVAQPDRLRHLTFRDLPDVLAPGDLVVVNTSATLAAATSGVVHAAQEPRDLPSPGLGASARIVPVHVATDLDDGTWVVEVRLLGGTGPDLSLRAGTVIDLAGGVRLTLTCAYPDPHASPSRLWRASVRSTAASRPAPSLIDYLSAHGRPIAYCYLAGRFPLTDYQNVYADQPGSAELVSAGRPFTDRLLVRLVTRGVTVAPLVLHAGVSSPEMHEPPAPERYEIPETTARLVNGARAAGRRVIAVGTTVVRALETVASTDGVIGAGTGWTDLVLDANRPARVVTGLITGLHEPEASHLLLLEAVAGPHLVAAAYRAAVHERYLWHEFGDSMLFLPEGGVGLGLPEGGVGLGHHRP